MDWCLIKQTILKNWLMSRFPYIEMVSGRGLPTLTFTILFSTSHQTSWAIIQKAWLSNWLWLVGKWYSKYTKSILRVFRELLKIKLANWHKTETQWRNNWKHNQQKERMDVHKQKIHRFVQLYHDQRILWFVIHAVKKVKNWNWLKNREKWGNYNMKPTLKLRLFLGNILGPQ